MIAGAEEEWRKRTGRPMTAELLERVLVLGTFGPDGSNGWDLWVPAACGVGNVSRGKTGTLIRLVPDSAIR